MLITKGIVLTHELLDVGSVAHGIGDDSTWASHQTMGNNYVANNVVGLQLEVGDERLELLLKSLLDLLLLGIGV